MRRKDREITDRDEMNRILQAGKVCRLGLSDQDQPYIVPLNYGYRWQEQGLVLYFHCADAGRKLDIIQKNNRACFEIDQALELQADDMACHFSMNYESLIGFGLVETVLDPDEKKDAMNCVMTHYSVKNDWTFDEKILAKTRILRLSVESLTGKRRNISKSD
jgi:nitroimidazol reductase NimA-like FMN-containing flavoprotein (pyridoxamine 5'-phosphate oxidase superfamily)